MVKAVAFLLAAFLLQGCVAAAVLPVVAAGAVGNQQVRAAKKRTRDAEASVGKGGQQKSNNSPTAAPPPDVELPIEEEAPTMVVVPETAGPPRLDASQVDNPYSAFAVYALDQAALRRSSKPVRGAILVESVSLTQPKSIDCGAKPLAVVIDLDRSPGKVAPTLPKSGFAALMGLLRENNIAVAWISERSDSLLAADLTALRSGENPVLLDRDMRLFSKPKGLRKQQLRWNLARSHCVIAIAGDRDGDFDELYDYLRSKDYAIRLEIFRNRGWFTVPPPADAILKPALSNNGN